MRIASLTTDIHLLNQAQSAAKELLTDDPELSSPENKKLAAQIEKLFEINADKLN